MKFCVIDDDAIVLKMISAVLEKSGHEVVTEVSGLRAEETVLAANPDCVITDLMMSPDDGLVVCQSLRRHSKLDDVPIIMLSSNKKNQDYWKKRAMEIGANGYMSKPITPNFAKEIGELIDGLKL